MPNFTGMWTSRQQMQARGANTWPALPGAPTSVVATVVSGTSVSVAFTAPADTGYPAGIVSYNVTSSPGGITAVGSSSPVTVSGLTTGTAYTFTVTATNGSGTGPASAASNSVTPLSFNENRIIIPLPQNTYQMRFLSHDWSTNTTTQLTVANPFYTDGGFYMPSVALDPSKNVYVNGGGGTSAAGYNNFAFVGANSSTVNLYQYYSGLYTSYGDKYGRLTWNPSAGAMQTNLFPFFVESSSTTAYILTVYSNSVSRGSSTPVFGADYPDMDLLHTYSTSGEVTLGTIMLAQAGNSISANNNFTFTASAPYTSFSAITGSFGGNAFGNAVAPVSLTSAVVIAAGFLQLVTSAGTTTALSSIGGISNGSFEQVTSLAGGAFVACNKTPYNTVYAYSNASNTPTWSTNLSSLVTGRQVLYMIGAGSTLYIVSKETSGSYIGYITKVEFNLTTGTYSSTDRSLGYAAHSQTYKPAPYRYY